MANDANDRKQLMRQFKKTLVKPLEDIGKDVGELHAVVIDSFRTDLDIAAATIDAMSAVVRQHIEGQLADVETTLKDVAKQVHMHATSELGAVGELLDSIPYSREIADQPTAEGYRHGSDERTADERAADPLSVGACPRFTVDTSSWPIVSPAVPQQTKTPTTPQQPQPTQIETQSPAGDETRKTEPDLSIDITDCSVDYWRNQLNSLRNEARVANYASLAATQNDVLSGIDDLFLPFTKLLSATPFADKLEPLKDYLKASLKPIDTASDSRVQCDKMMLDGNAVLYLGTRIASLFFGALVDPAKHNLEYSLKGRCPYIYPGTDGALSAYLADSIDINTARSWSEIQGECWEPVLKLLEARRSKPVPMELFTMRRRSIITESEYFASMRRLGYTHKDDVANLYKLTTQVPPMSELLRYMVRDVADDKLWIGAGSDETFPDKWKGKVKEWGEQQGIEEDFAKASWRAHWTLPAPGQLAEFYHRLRKLPDGDSRKVTLDEIRTTLVQQDILPKWVDKYLAVSFRPLGRIDIRRAYNAGSLTFPEVETAYSQLGYDDPTAHRLTVFTDTLRNQAIYNTPPIKQWRQELIDRNKAAQQLLDLKYDAAIVAESLDVAAKMQRSNSAVKLFGQQKITRQEAGQRLTNHGITPADYNSWLDNAALNYRNSPAVKLFARDVITREEAEQRLKAAGIADDLIKLWLDDTAANRSTNDAIAEYTKGLISNNQARVQMAADGLPQGRIDQLLNKADDKRQSETNNICTAALVKRYLHGEFDAGDLQQKLVGVGVAPDFAEELVMRANCQQAAIGKDPTTAQLCEWLDLGLMTPAQFVERLERIGWQNAEAINILVQCQTKHGAARAKAAESEAKQEAAAMAKTKQLIQRQNTAIAKDEALRQRKAEQASKVAAKRESLLLDAADKIRGVVQLSLQESAALMRAEKNRVQSAYALQLDDAIAAVVRGVELYTADQNESLSDAIDSSATAIVALQDSVDRPATNGFSKA